MLFETDIEMLPNRRVIDNASDLLYAAQLLAYGDQVKRIRLEKGKKDGVDSRDVPRIVDANAGVWLSGCVEPASNPSRQEQWN